MWEILVSAFIAFIGWYVTTNYTAFRDGVRNPLVFKAAWWPCYTAYSVETKLSVLRASITCHNEAQDVYKQMFTLDCAIVARNNIIRCNPEIDISQFKIDNTEFVTYVTSFHKMFNEVNK